MGLFDTVELFEGVHLPEYPDGVASASDVTWQTKDIDRPCMDTFRITADGHLYKEEVHYKRVPPEDRPYAGQEDVDEDDFRYLAGCRERVHDGWVHRDAYHGLFRITHSFDAVESLVAYQVTFTYGRLEGFERTR